MANVVAFGGVNALDGHLPPAMRLYRPAFLLNLAAERHIKLSYLQEVILLNAIREAHEKEKAEEITK